MLAASLSICLLWIDVAVDLSLLAASDGASVASMTCSRAGRQATTSYTCSAADRSCSISRTLCFGMSETTAVFNMEYEPVICLLHPPITDWFELFYFSATPTQLDAAAADCICLLFLVRLIGLVASQLLAC